MIIEEIDVDDDAAISEWYRPLLLADRGDWPELPSQDEHELRVIVRDRDDDDNVLFVARDDGVAIGSLRVNLPRRENRQVAWFRVTVDPAHRGRGAGRALLERGEQVARALGRVSATGSSHERVGVASSRGERFAVAAGYAAARRDARRLLTLPVAPGFVAELEAAALPHAGPYDVVTWVGACPPALAADRAELARVMSVDTPRGELDRDEETWDLDRLRRWERLVEEAGRTLLVAGAVERSSGTLVGFSELAVSRSSPALALQFDTVVARAHRGHRLGLLVKIATLRVLEERSPSTAMISTINAVSNEPMIRVNETMGFELISVGTTWQKRLS